MDLDKIERIKQIASVNGDVDLLSFHFINLELIERTAGAAWPKLRKKVFGVSRHFLEKRLSQDDIIIKLQDGFLVVFAHIYKEQADVFGKQLGKDINQFFIGDESLGDLQVVSKHNRVTHEKLDKTLLEIEKEMQMHSTSYVDKALRGTKNKQKYALKNCTIFYRPIWDSTQEIISSNACIAHLSYGGQQLYGSDVLLEKKSKARLLEFDLLTLTDAQKIFTEFVNKQKRCVITVTVSYKTLKYNDSRIAYFGQLLTIPKHLRKFFLICVDAIPAGAPQGALIEIFRSLHSLCGATLVHNPPLPLDVNFFRECNVSLFGFSIQEHLKQGGALTKHHLETISSFCAHAHKLRAMTYVTEVNDLDHIPILREIGVRYFSGPCIGQESKTPALPSTLHTTNVFCPKCRNKDTCTPPPGHPVPCSEFENAMKKTGIKP